MGAGRGEAVAGAGVFAAGVVEGAGLPDGAELAAAEGEGFADGVWTGEAVADGDGDGAGEAVGTGVNNACGADGCGTGVTAGTEVAPSSGGGVPRFWNAEISAPMPSPATMTPMISAVIGSGPPPPVPPALDRGGGELGRRRRGWGSGIASRFPRIRQEALPPRANAADMIRVRVPIDVNAVLCADSVAFALATPLRVGELLTHAVLDALGPRAPQDKRERMVASTHAGLNAGAFIVEIDGRIYEHCDDVTVVAGIANLRFYRRERRDTAA